MRYRALSEGAVTAIVQHAPVVAPEKETILWHLKVSGDHSPLALQRAMFY